MKASRWQGKVRRFVDLPGADKSLFCRAVIELAIARVQLANLSFERLAARLSGDAATIDELHENVRPDPGLPLRIAFAVRAAAANLPWHPNCFPQAIAARALLKRHGFAPRIHLGVERIGDDALAGHAWLSCGDTIVLGGEDLGRYTEIHRFPGP